MTDTGRATAAQAIKSTRAGVYFAVLQLVFTLGWTVYVIYLPKLAAQVGIAPSAVIWILMLDQAIFTIADTAMGAAADRTARIVGRLGRFVGLLAAISCAAFVALPFVAGTGPGAQIWFIALIVVWAITSSALRAPPLVLLGKYGARPSLPMLSALVMLGYGVASAVSPHLGTLLRDIDARLPFVISSAVLLVTALALSKVERNLVAAAPSVTPLRVAPKPFGMTPLLFVAAMAILALGFQLHVSINSAPAFLRFVTPADMVWLAPIFWIGFNAATLLFGVVGKHIGALTTIGIAGVVGGLALLAAHLAGSLGLLIAAQLIAGAAWGCVLAGAIAAAFALGETGAEGKVVGLVFSALALATFMRMGAVATGLNKMPDYTALLQWAPVACWLIAGMVVLVLAVSRIRRPARREPVLSKPSSSSGG